VQIVLLLLVNVAVFLTFVGRWWIAVRGTGFQIPLLNLLRYRLAAFGITYFTPGPQFGGEPYQVYALSRWHGVPVSAAVSTVTVDKLVELLANFTFLLAGVTVSLQLRLLPAMQGPLIVAAVLLLLSVPLAYLLVVRAGLSPVASLLAGLASRMPPSARLERVRTAAGEAEGQVCRVLRDHPRMLFGALIYSGISWLGLILEYWLALSFLGLQLSLPEAVGVLTAARIAFLLPIPAGLGTLEAGQVLAVTALGADPAYGISISLLVRARDVLFGGAGLWWGGLLGVGRARSALSVKQLAPEAEDVEHPPLARG
jgi:uncharacterized protein (TIRG00374 family)